MSNDSTTLKTCTICHKEKPLSDYYLQHTGKPNPVCIPCFLSRHKAYVKKAVTDASQPHEQQCIEYMRSLGIYATTGKASEFAWVDLVAWGCIKIEVKLGEHSFGRERSSNWLWRFSNVQIKKRLLADVIVLIIPYETPEYYVFEATHPVFYKGGRLKTGVQYMERPAHRKNRKTSVPMTPEMMNAARDDWTILLDKMPDLRAIRSRVVETAIQNMNVKQKVLI